MACVVTSTSKYPISVSHCLQFAHFFFSLFHTGIYGSLAGGLSQGSGRLGCAIVNRRTLGYVVGSLCSLSEETSVRKQNNNLRYTIYTRPGW